MLHTPEFDLDAVSGPLLDPHATAASREAACAAFHQHCLAHLPTLGADASTLAAGHALAPADAARCVLDHARTAALVRALDARIAARAAAGRATRVLYAGCGPLAPLALLIARRWRGRGVRFDLVDIHEQSIAAAARLFALAGAAETLGAMRCADAATLRLEADAARPDILVAEVMQRALMREPQVAVVANLWPQCAPDAALVPECIAVDAVAAPPAHTGSDAGRPLGRLLTLAAATVPAIGAALRDGAAALPEIVLRVPQDSAEGSAVWLATHIQAGPGEALSGADSGLTLPLLVAQLGRVAAGEALGFSYRLGPEPGFAVRRMPQSPHNGGALPPPASRP